MENNFNPEIAACGLCCGACPKFTKGKCPGCHVSENVGWCKVRKCCIENGWQSCADCTIANPRECKTLNNFISKVFTVIFRSDRHGCLDRIREVGYEAYAAEMKLAGSMNRPVAKR